MCGRFQFRRNKTRFQKKENRVKRLVKKTKMARRFTASLYGYESGYFITGKKWTYTGTKCPPEEFTGYLYKCKSNLTGIHNCTIGEHRCVP